MLLSAQDICYKTVHLIRRHLRHWIHLIKFKGLLFKTLVLVNLTAAAFLYISFSVVTEQQRDSFGLVITSIKQSHQRSIQQILTQQLKRQDIKQFLTLGADQHSARIDSATHLVRSIMGTEIDLMSPVIEHQQDKYKLPEYSQRISDKLLVGYSGALPELDVQQVSQLESSGLTLTLGQHDYFVWLQALSIHNLTFKAILARDITSLMRHQNTQQNQIVVVFIAITTGILITLILFSVLPIRQINKLKNAITLIANKNYNSARKTLGQPRKKRFADELNELESEFHHAIDVLESYEKELINSQRRLLKQATIDSITGLYTRNVLIEDLSKYNAPNDHTKVAVFFLDLDGFKPVNDNLGHEAGDIVLKKVGYRLKGVSNKSIRVYRLGGDEFVIAYFDYPDTDALVRMADILIGLFNAPFNVYDVNLSISASIGIALKTPQKGTPDQLLRYADIAMYQAKAEGKSRYKFFDESMRAANQLRFSIKNDFKKSLLSNQLFMVYQPIVDSRTREVVKVEALCRWQHPSLGFISPPIFIDVLEESENMTVLFEFILQQVMQTRHMLACIGRADIITSINISPSQLVDLSAIESLQALLEEYQVESKCIEIEITETTLITNYKRAQEWISQASAAGFKVAIDDFGAGYSSLSYLASFSYDTVKLDRSLLDRIDVDTKQQRIVGSLTQMLQKLNISIVAEGAETEQQFTMLTELGCEYVQGYHIAKPMEADKLRDFLSVSIKE